MLVKPEFQSVFACEMAEERQYQFKSQFATNLHSLYSSVVSSEEQDSLDRREEDTGDLEDTDNHQVKDYKVF